MTDRLLFEVAGSKEHMDACEDRMEGWTGTEAKCYYWLGGGCHC